VDIAAQPMQAAPVAAMRELARSGNAAKLILAFTHFDEVEGTRSRLYLIGSQMPSHEGC
jgi:hypothetical protein